MKFSSKLLFTAIFGVGLIVSGGSSANNSVRQSTDMVQFDSGQPVRGVAVLTRDSNSITLDASTTDLNSNSAYSVWWVVFNRPRNCLIPDVCSDSDVFEGPGDLSDVQIPSVRISVFYAAGFVTGNDGVATFTARLDDGSLPEGTFVNFGWSSPVGPGADDNSGLTRGNGLDAEIHVVLRTHGQTLAGSVAEQTTTFNGLCDVQDCADVQAAIFRAPERAMGEQCIDTDGDGWGWNGFETCIP